MPVSRLLLTIVLTLAAAPNLTADPIRCDLTAYKPVEGADRGRCRRPARAVVARRSRPASSGCGSPIADGRPLIRDLAIRGAGAAWAVLGENLDARVPRRDRRPPHDDAAGRSAAGRRRRDHAGRHRQEPLVCVLGCAARNTGAAGARWPRAAGEPRPRRAADRERDPPRRRDVQRVILPRVAPTARPSKSASPD